MSDQLSSLPVRTENPGDVIAKLADATTPSQQLAIDASGRITVKIDDGAGNGVTSQANGGQQALDVGINVAGVQIDPRSIRALTSADVVTVDQGTSPWITKDQSNGPVAPGTAASFSSLIGGQYSASLPTLTDGQQSAIQVDSHGRLLVETSSLDDHNYGAVGSNTLRTAAQIGNATGAADFNAGATGAQTLRVSSNQGAPGTAANGWFVRPTDGTNSQSYTAGGEAKVDMTSSFEDHNYGTVGANTLRTAAQIGNATGAADFNAGATGAQTLRTVANQGAPNTVANSWFTSITNGTNTASVSAGGELSVTVSTPLPAGSNTIGSVGVTNLPTTVDTNYGAVGANTLRSAAQIGNATGAADFNNGATGAQTLRVAANLAVGGANVSNTNPIPVSMSAAPIGTAINDYKDASAIAAGSSDNHDYSITSAKTFQGKKIWASASGLMKIEVQISPDGSTFVTKWVGFNSTAEPNISIDMDEMVFLESGAGAKIRVICTNLDKKPMDLYSTISGLEV